MTTTKDRPNFVLFLHNGQENRVVGGFISSAKCSYLGKSLTELSPHLGFRVVDLSTNEIVDQSLPVKPKAAL